MRYHIIGGHIALQTSGDNVGLSTCVRVFNAGTTGFQIITVQDASSNVIGEIHLNFGQSIDIQKDPTHELLIDGGTVFITPVAINA